MKVLKGTGLFFLAACLLVAVSGCGLFKTGIALEDYISYEYEGVNEYGSLAASVDVEKILTDYGEKIDEEKTESFRELLSGLQLDVSKSENLCNGDEVEIRVDYDEELCENAGVRFKNNTVKVTIEGLEEGELLDLFADISVEVRGTAPLATASVQNKSSNEFIRNLTFTLDKTTGFMPEDGLTVSCDLDFDAAREQGYVVLQTEKDYDTSGIASYVQNGEELTAEDLKPVIEEAENTVISETESSQRRMLYRVTGISNFLFQYNREWIDSIELYDMQLFTCVDTGQITDGSVPYNMLLIVFKAYVTNADHGSDGYFCFAYSNLVRNGDGSVVIKHDDPQLRYLCDDDYEELMAKVAETILPIYAQNAVNIAKFIE
ncbi:MAG: hypothetical protein NC086_06425 [Alistipes sp.]|nr:hypothetical protein [Alistipes sp.]